MKTAGLARVLYVEDEVRIAHALRRGLLPHGFAVEVAKTGRECRSLVATDSFDAYLLDLGLPDDDGMRICSDLRRMGVRAPIFIVTADDRPSSEIEAFGIGADDYLVKPVDCGALAARLAAARRKAELRRPLRRVGAITIDPDARVAYVEDARLDLTRQDYALLALLAERPEELVERGEIERRLWGAENENTRNRLDVQVRRLRLKLRTAATQVVTVPGRGLRLVANVAAAETAAARERGASVGDLTILVR